jgi:hypothetical protein
MRPRRAPRRPARARLPEREQPERNKKGHGKSIRRLAMTFILKRGVSRVPRPPDGLPKNLSAAPGGPLESIFSSMLATEILRAESDSGERGSVKRAQVKHKGRTLRPAPVCARQFWLTRRLLPKGFESAAAPRSMKLGPPGSVSYRWHSTRFPHSHSSFCGGSRDVRRPSGYTNRSASNPCRALASMDRKGAA